MVCLVPIPLKTAIPYWTNGAV